MCMQAGYLTVQSFILHPKKVLVNIKGLAEAKVDKMVDVARRMFAGATWQTAAALGVQVSRGSAVSHEHCTRVPSKLSQQH